MSYLNWSLKAKNGCLREIKIKVKSVKDKILPNGITVNFKILNIRK